MNKFFSLPFIHKALFIKTTILMSLVRISLWIFPFSFTHKLWGENQRHQKNERKESSLLVYDLVRAVSVLSRYVPAATCLTQAYTLHFLMSQEGYLSKLQIGFAKTGDNQFEAHAWVENEDGILIGDLPDLNRFHAFPHLEKLIP